MKHLIISFFLLNAVNERKKIAILSGKKLNIKERNINEKEITKDVVYVS